MKIDPFGFNLNFALHVHGYLTNMTAIFESVLPAAVCYHTVCVFYHQNESNMSMVSASTAAFWPYTQPKQKQIVRVTRLRRLISLHFTKNKMLKQESPYLTSLLATCNTIIASMPYSWERNAKVWSGGRRNRWFAVCSREEDLCAMMVCWFLLVTGSRAHNWLSQS